MNSYRLTEDQLKELLGKAYEAGWAGARELKDEAVAELVSSAADKRVIEITPEVVEPKAQGVAFNWDERTFEEITANWERRAFQFNTQPITVEWISDPRTITVDWTAPPTGPNNITVTPMAG